MSVIISCSHANLTSPHHAGSSSRKNSSSSAHPPRTSSRSSRISQEPRTGSMGDRGDGALNQSHLNVPQPSSHSVDQPESTGTALTGATVGDGTESIGRRSKRSLTGRRRTASRASSKRSQQPAGQLSEKGNPSPIAESPTSTAASKPRKKQSPSLFRSLLCCMPPSSANAVDHDNSSLASRTSNKINSKEKASIPTGRKQESSAAESSTLVSTPLPHDGDASYSGSTSAIPERSGTGDSTVNGNAPDQTGPLRKVSAGKEPSEKSSSLSPNPPRIATEDSAQAGNGRTVPNPTLVIQSATPVDPLPENADPIHDRTPKQEQTDEDIEMKDNAPHIPLAPGDVRTSEDDDSGSASSSSKVALPPPPPPGNRPVMGTEEQNSQQPDHNALAVASAEPPRKWLLGEIRPEHKGRKCLVLDLDETLVHSSFKV